MINQKDVISWLKSEGWKITDRYSAGGGTTTILERGDQEISLTNWRLGVEDVAKVYGEHPVHIHREIMQSNGLIPSAGDDSRLADYTRIERLIDVYGAGGDGTWASDTVEDLLKKASNMERKINSLRKELSSILEAL